MSAPSLSNFTAHIRKNNVFRANQYYIELTTPPLLSELLIADNIGPTDISMLSMMCCGASTPFSGITTQDQYLENNTRRKYAYDQDYQNLTLQFYIDQDYTTKRFFDQWKDMIVPNKRSFNYPDDYTAESMNVFILNQAGDSVYKYEYSRVFPKTIQSIDLNYSPANSPATFTVEFVFEEVYHSTIITDTQSIPFKSKPDTITIESPSLLESPNREIKNAILQSRRSSPFILG